MKKPFIFKRRVDYALSVEANSLAEAQAIADSTWLTYWTASETTRVKITGGEQLYMCLRCGNPTAEKQPDIQGWDGYCSKCGMIAQSQVGDPA